MEQNKTDKKQQASAHKETSIPGQTLRDHTEDLVDHYWGSINYVFGLIKASEIKAGLILSFYGILLNLVYQHVDMIFKEGIASIALFTIMGLWLLCTIGSMYFSIRCFMPRIERTYDDNIFFFGDIISKFGTIKEFSKQFYQTSLKEEDLFFQLGQQIFIISKIAAYKFRNVNRSLRLLAVGLLLLLSAATFIVIVEYAS